MNTNVKTMRFWLMWIGASLLVYPLAVGLLIVFSLVFAPLTDILFSDYSYGINSTIETVYFLILGSAVGGIIGLSIALLQKAVIKRYFHIDMAYLRRTTTIGGMIAAPIMLLMMERMNTYFYTNYYTLVDGGTYTLTTQALTMLPMVLYVTIMSAVQVVILRQYIQQAWLWIAANAVAGMMFGTLVSNVFDPGFGNWLLAAIAQGAVTGFAMLWLLHRLTKDTIPTEEREYAYQHVPIDTDDRSDPSVWDDAY